MLRNISIQNLWILNIIFMLVWHILCFVACVYINTKYFDWNRKMYQMKKWEKNGKWYVSHLAIKKWKDLLPQHVGKDGFSKEHFTGKSIKYIDDFILETCRGEWDHSMCCIYGIIALAINPLWLGLIFLFATLIINLPFIAIQRYNRIRLQILRKRLLREELRNVTVDKNKNEGEVV